MYGLCSVLSLFLLSLRAMLGHTLEPGTQPNWPSTVDRFLLW